MNPNKASISILIALWCRLTKEGRISRILNPGYKRITARILAHSIVTNGLIGVSYSMKNREAA